jgi:hypothetical protein
MLTIGITLDDVLRAKTAQIGKIYKKYIDSNINLEKLDFSTDNYSNIFNFKSKTDFIKFLYEDYVFEIFGEAGMVEKTLDKELNLWHIALNDDDEIDEEVKLILTNSREFNASIGYTYFFLSKMGTRIREVYLPEDYMTIWDKCDVLVTADKKLLSKKPDNKISVKIDTTYNCDNDADFNYDSMMSLLKDKMFLKKIVNFKNKKK